MRRIRNPFHRSSFGFVFALVSTLTGAALLVGCNTAKANSYRNKAEASIALHSGSHSTINVPPHVLPDMGSRPPVIGGPNFVFTAAAPDINIDLLEIDSRSFGLDPTTTSPTFNPTTTSPTETVKQQDLSQWTPTTEDHSLPKKSLPPAAQYVDCSNGTCGPAGAVSRSIAGVGKRVGSRVVRPFGGRGIPLVRRLRRG